MSPWRETNIEDCRTVSAQALPLQALVGALAMIRSVVTHERGRSIEYINAIGCHPEGARRPRVGRGPGLRRRRRRVRAHRRAAGSDDMTMIYRRVTSSTVSHVGYDRDARVLAVGFRTPGGAPPADEYRYAGVPPDVADRLVGEALRVSAGVPGASVGKLFHRTVRDRYLTTRVAAGDVDGARRVEDQVARACCLHGNDLTNDAGELAEPACGCRLTTSLKMATAAVGAALVGAEFAYRRRGDYPGERWDEVKSALLSELCKGGRLMPAPPPPPPPPPAGGAVSGPDPFALSERLVRGGSGD